MFAVDLFFKNGKKLEGLIWTWRPQYGWFEALDESNGEIKKYFLRDVQAGSIYPDRVRIQTLAKDFLEHAKSEGYQD